MEKKDDSPFGYLQIFANLDTSKPIDCDTTVIIYGDGGSVVFSGTLDEYLDWKKTHDVF